MRPPIHETDRKSDFVLKFVGGKGGQRLEQVLGVILTACTHKFLALCDFPGSFPFWPEFPCRSFSGLMGSPACFLPLLGRQPVATEIAHDRNGARTLFRRMNEPLRTEF